MLQIELNVSLNKKHLRKRITKILEKTDKLK